MSDLEIYLLIMLALFSPFIYGVLRDGIREQFRKDNEPWHKK